MDVKQIIQSGLDTIQRTMNRTLDGLSPTEFKWQPRPDANSIGLILFHMLRIEDSSTYSLLQGKPQLWESQKWHLKMSKAVDDGGAHYTAEQVATFVVPPIPVLMSYAESVHKATFTYLKSLSSEEFNKKVIIPPRPGPPRPSPFGENPTAGFMWQMLVTHLAQHAGEISYLRGLQRGMDK